jgi:hypothetical protein
MCRPVSLVLRSRKSDISKQMESGLAYGPCLAESRQVSLKRRGHLTRCCRRASRGRATRCGPSRVVSRQLFHALLPTRQKKRPAGRLVSMPFMSWILRLSLRMRSRTESMLCQSAPKPSRNRFEIVAGYDPKSLLGPATRRPAQAPDANRARRACPRIDPRPHPRGKSAHARVPAVFPEFVGAMPGALARPTPRPRRRRLAR